jgi:3'(2'), 5'-bisphosphate nucleotidase
MYSDQELIKIAIEAAISGGIEILDVYSHDFEVEFKDDKSPLTLADKRAHDAISGFLSKTGLPILSEEGKHISYEERREWEKFWLVDPLDGTKEFVKRNGEFTVNIALIIDGRAEMGVIFVPVSGVLYFASDVTGARKTAVNSFENIIIDDLIAVSESLPSQKTPDLLTIVCSRSHMSPETGDFIEQLKKKGRELEYISIGSSLKLCLIAEGKAHIYPRFGPTMEWDTAAGQAIVEKAGGKVLKTVKPEPVKYNKEDLLNPWFIASRSI